ncbi:hypothetical protein H1C71_036113, partial [Ictidomys tridecemlineatus]
FHSPSLEVETAVAELGGTLSTLCPSPSPIQEGPRGGAEVRLALWGIPVLPPVSCVLLGSHLASSGLSEQTLRHGGPPLPSGCGKLQHMELERPRNTAPWRGPEVGSHCL